MTPIEAGLKQEIAEGLARIKALILEPNLENLESLGIPSDTVGAILQIGGMVGVVDYAYDAFMGDEAEDGWGSDAKVDLNDGGTQQQVIAIVENLIPKLEDIGTEEALTVKRILEFLTDK